MPVLGESVHDLQDELRFQKALNDIVNMIHAAPNIADILTNATERVRRLLDCERLTIYAVDVDTQELYSVVKIDNLLQSIRVARDVNSIAGYCAVTKQLVNIRDAYDMDELARINPRIKFDRRWDARTGIRTRQILATPIEFESYLLGVLQMINKRNGGSFTAADQKAADEIARTLGIAFYNQNRAARATTSARSKFASLVERGLISERDLEAALTLAKVNGRDAGTVLISRYGISKEAIGKALSEFFDCPFFDYDGARLIPEQLRHRVDAEFWRRNRCAPIERKPGVLVAAVVDPFDLNTINTIKSTGIAPRLQVQVALEGDIQDYLNRSFSLGPTESAESELAEIITELGADEGGVEESTPASAVIGENDSAIVRLANRIIVDAHRAGASDIHIEPGGNEDPCLIRFRRDGDCYRYQEIPPSHRAALVSRLKVMAQLDIAEKRKPQDGKIRFRLPDGQPLELRVATLPTAGPGNEDVVMRLLAASKPIPFDQLGMSSANLKAFKEIIEKPYGIVLCVGPTGSGKTTTLHSALGHLNTTEVKIWTAEDPVEITQKGARQVQVNPKIGFTFAAAMRAFLRADPDIIMLGEMRDSETAAMGIEAALTGHLVLSTLHTNNAPETITRLSDMGQDPFTFADALLGILAQRLARTICKACREPYQPGEAEFDAIAEGFGRERLAAQGIHSAAELVLYRGTGCEECEGSGYRGRIGLHELLTVSDDIKHMIIRRAPVEQIREAAIAGGMATLLQDGIWKVLEGRTDLRQIHAVCMR